MSAPYNAAAEESLDPEDWEALQRLGHRMVGDRIRYLQTVRERPSGRECRVCRPVSVGERGETKGD